ncbi:transcriptional regulator, XRE family [candidate division TM7 genomosp. GTL1]|nr:transcriptional regulator, XRE family [candidate division TM7 genomosp. GTL1]
MALILLKIIDRNITFDIIIYMEPLYKQKIGKLIQQNRLGRGFTQAEMAKALGTSQSAINRIENGGQNLSMEMLARISDVLNSEIVSIAHAGTLNFRIHGGHELSGEIEVKTSKNAAVALLCASLLNRGTTTLRRVARIEEVNRIIEVLNSIGVKTRWLGESDLEITPPGRLKLENMDLEAARKTRTVIMFLGPLLHLFKEFKLPYAGGCTLGTRTVEPHLAGLSHFGLDVVAETGGFYEATVEKVGQPVPIILTERGDTVTENILMAAARIEGETVIHNASPNYMVQDVCLFLQKLGVKIEGIGTTNLKIQGVKNINMNVEYSPSEDPIEAMSLITAGIVTKSEITVKRVPIEFVEIELETLKDMGLQYTTSKEYKARNGHTRLVDITTQPSELRAPKDAIKPMPFPGLNIDNLPFFANIAAVSEGRTLLHDWVYENRAIYFTELSKLNTKVELLDPHRVYVEGPTRWKPADVVCPPALRPAVVILLGMLAAPGTSVLRNVYSINRGYEDLATRLNSLGAQIETFREI